jgi:hypothetical protein
LNSLAISASWSLFRRSSWVFGPKGTSSLVNAGGDFKA